MTLSKLGGKAIANELEKNKTLKILTLCIFHIIQIKAKTYIENEGGIFIGQSLLKNNTLTQLNLCILSQ